MPAIMSSSTKRKNKPLKTSNRSKLSSQNSIPSGEGAYTNPRLMHTLLTLMGTKCNVQVKNGGIYQGIFHTANPNMDIVLGAAHKHEAGEKDGKEVKSVHSALSTGPLPPTDKIIDELIFRSKDLVCAVFQDVDLTSAEVPIKSNGDAPHETNISPTNGDPLRTLEPWDGGGDATADADIGGLEDDLSSPAGQNGGWCPEDMFRTNTRQYGVKTSYNPSLPEYTTKLQEDDSEEYQKRKARAQQLADEMEKSPSYQKRVNLELEDSQTEEEKFSSVIREGSSSAPRSERPRMDRNDQRDRFPRARGRGKEPSGARMGYGNFMGPGGVQRGQPPSTYVPRERAMTPTNPAESPTSPGTGKIFTKTSTNQQSLPPRFNKGHGSGGMYRDEDRINRPHDPSYQSAYSASQQPKPQRQGSSSSRNYQRNHPSPTSEYSSAQTVSEPSSGRNTPQQPLSRNSSASSGTQQQVTSPGWGNKPMGGPPAEVPHPVAAPAPSGPGQMSVRPRYPTSNKDFVRSPLQRRCSVPRILGRPPQSQALRSPFRDRRSSRPDISYSSVLRSTNKPGPPPTMQPPMATSSFPENRMRQPGYTPAVSNVGPGAKFVYSPRGHSPPQPSASATAIQSRDIPTQPIHPHQHGIGQASPRAQPAGVTKHGQQQFLSPSPAQAPAESKGPTKVLAKKSSEGISHSRDSDSERKTVKELKAFQENFILQPPSSADSSKTQPGSSQAKPILSSNAPQAYSKARTPVQPLNRLPSSQESPGASTPAQQTVVPPVTQPPPPQPVVQASVAVPPPQTLHMVQQSPGPVALPPMQAAPHNMTQPPPPAPQQPIAHQAMEGVEGGVIPQPVFMLQGPAPVVIQPMQQPPPVHIIQPVEQPQQQQPAINVHSPRSATVAPAVNTVSAATGFVSPQHGGISTASEQTAQPPLQSAVTQQQLQPEAIVAPAASTSSPADTSTAPTSGEQAAAQPPTSAAGTSDNSPDTAHQLNPDAKEFTPRSLTKSSGLSTPNSPTQVTPQPVTINPAYFPNQHMIVYNKKRVGQTTPTIISPSGGDPSVVSHHMTQPIHQTIAGPQYQPQFILTPNTQHIAGQAGVMTQPYQDMGQMMYQGHMVPTTPRAVYSNETAIYGSYFPQQAPQQTVQPGQQPHQHQPPQQPQQPQQQQQAQPPQPPPAQQAQQPSQPQPAQQPHMGQGAYIQQPRPHSAHTPNQALPPTSPATNMQQPAQQPGVAVNAPPPMHPPSQNAMIASQPAFYPQPMIGHSMHGAPAMVPSSPHGYATQINPRYMMIPQGGAAIAHSPNPNPAQQGYVQQNVATSAPTHVQQYTPRQTYQQPVQMPTYPQQTN